MAAAVHTVAAATVGRRWEPGDAVCGGYLTVVTVLIAIAYVGAAGPALVLFAWTMWALTHRLEQALRDADEARTRLERHLDDVRQLNERLTELDRLKDDFVSTASHELRTPLTVILGFSATLNGRWDMLDVEQRRDLSTRIEAHARSLEGIVATLLDTARIERGTLMPRHSRVTLHTAVDSAVERLRPLLRGRVVRTEPRWAPSSRSTPRSGAARRSRFTLTAWRDDHPPTAV